MPMKGAYDGHDGDHSQQFYVSFEQSTNDKHWCPVTHISCCTTDRQVIVAAAALLRTNGLYAHMALAACSSRASACFT